MSTISNATDIGTATAGAAVGGVRPPDAATPEIIPDAVDPDRRAPGRPRSARADEAIVEAVLDMLADGVSVEALSIEAVASRAGVGKATIYRRWPNKEALIIEAVGKIKGPPPEISGTSIREDLLTLLRPIGAAPNTRAGKIMPCLIPEIQRNPELHRRYQKIVEPRRERMREVLRRGIADGQLRPDLDLDVCIALLMSPMLVQTVLKWQPDLDLTTLPDKIVDGVLPGMMVPGCP
jgi:AcrR family transcriptional regulator